MNRYQYADRDEYVSKQVLWNKRKLSMVWVTDEAIRIVVEEIRDHCRQVKFGICHGTRRGIEQERLRSELGCEVIGTEISDTATEFSNTIQWDFHDVKPEWIGAVDFIYSNSLDHAFDSEMAVKQWMRCLRPGGLCFIDWSDEDHGDTHVNDLDCFGASREEMEVFLGRFGTLTVRSVEDRHRGHVIFVIRNDVGTSSSTS